MDTNKVNKESFLVAYSEVLAQNPWLVQFPILLTDVRC
jgi:hypothetical protein